METDKLKDYFKFDEEDLRANQNGHLSENQKARMLKVYNHRRRNGIGTGGCLFIIAIPGFLIPLVLFLLSRSGGSAYNIFGIVWLIAWAALGIYFIRPAFVKFDESVKMAKGPASIVKVEKSWKKRYQPRGYYTIHELHIGDNVFRVLSEVENILTQGSVYTAYYQKGHTDEILSAELMD